MGTITTFLDLCNTFEKIAATTKRLEIQEILSTFLTKVYKTNPGSLSAVLFLCTATFHPQHHGIELGIGDHAILSAVATATGLSIKSVRQKYVTTGDLGVIAMAHRVRQLFVVQKRLTVIEVLQTIRRIAKETGKSSSNSKMNLMLQLLNASSSLETKYLVRLFESKLKIGLALQTVLISLALTFNDDLETEEVEPNNKDDLTKTNTNNKAGHPLNNNLILNQIISNEDAIQIVKEAFSKQPDFEILVKVAIRGGIRALNEGCKITPGVPLKPMLAQPSKNLAKAFSRVEDSKFVSEFKYDGERAQLHHKDGNTKIFSRNLEEISLKYQDLMSLKLSDKSFIIDAEIVAYDNGKILPFQVLSTRKRKNIDKIEVGVCIFVFDILYFNEEELLDKPLSRRREILRNNFTEIENKFRFVDSVECNSIEDIDAHFKSAIKGSCEGVMLKSLDSVYRPSLRTNSWVKLKSDYLEDLGDSVDLVVMGVFYGKGKRTGAYGGFLLGVYNEDMDKFEACCKIGTGFSDGDLQRIHDELNCTITTDTSEYVYKQGVSPDRWVSPRYVWEVKAASLSLSPIYSAGSWEDKGISLRFPRYLRIRNDKGPREATTSNQILRMYLENKEESGDEFN